MKNTFKKLVMLVLALSMIFTLCACGGDSSATNGSESNKGSENVGGSETESEKENPIIPEVETLSDSFLEGNAGVWLICSEVEETALIEGVLVIKEGECKFYSQSLLEDCSENDKAPTLGELSLLTEQEIIEKVESNYVTYINDILANEKILLDEFEKQVIETTQEYKKEGYGKPWSAWIKQNGNYYCFIKSSKYVIPVAMVEEYYNKISNYTDIVNYPKTEFKLELNADEGETKVTSANFTIDYHINEYFWMKTFAYKNYDYSSFGASFEKEGKEYVSGGYYTVKKASSWKQMRMKNFNCTLTDVLEETKVNGISFGGYVAVEGNYKTYVVKMVKSPTEFQMGEIITGNTEVQE